jgi:hypothetical protein
MSGAIPAKVAPKINFKAASLMREPTRVPIATDIVAGTAITTTLTRSSTVVSLINEPISVHFLEPLPDETVASDAISTAAEVEFPTICVGKAVAADTIYYRYY